MQLLRMTGTHPALAGTRLKLQLTKIRAGISPHRHRLAVVESGVVAWIDAVPEDPSWGAHSNLTRCGAGSGPCLRDAAGVPIPAQSFYAASNGPKFFEE